MKQTKTKDCYDCSCLHMTAVSSRKRITRILSKDCKSRSQRIFINSLKDSNIALSCINHMPSFQKPFFQREGSFGEQLFPSSFRIESLNIKMTFPMSLFYVIIFNQERRHHSIRKLLLSPNNFNNFIKSLDIIFFKEIINNICGARTFYTFSYS